MTKDCGKRHTRKYVMSQITAIKLKLSICDRSETECGSQISSHNISNNILSIQRTKNTWITNTNLQWHNWIHITTWVQECSISTFGRKEKRRLSDSLLWCVLSPHSSTGLPYPQKWDIRMYAVEVTFTLQLAAYWSVLHPTVNMLPQCVKLPEYGTKQHGTPQNVHAVCPCYTFSVFNSSNFCWKMKY